MLIAGIRRVIGLRKRMNAGELKPERVDLFEKLLALADENKHVNQYV